MGSMEIKENYDLSKLNTFGIVAKTKYFAEVNTEEEFKQLIKTKEFQDNPRLFLGGGSNILFTKDWNGITIHNKLKGIEIVSENESEVKIRVMGGEIWHDLVNFTVDRGYWGIENLSLVPGTVGAAPMQNIGAYGGELKNTLENVEAYDLKNGDKKIFSNKECKLGYRDSVFKKELKGKYFITAITLKLSKLEKKNISYKILANYLLEHNITVKNPKDVSEAVASIRRSKLPDPKIIGNAGSFFKNVFVSPEELENLRKYFPDVPSFQEEDKVKIPAAWLIENTGPSTSLRTSWKGWRDGKVGVHERQALVLVNYGGAKGEEVLELAQKIIASVKEKFGLALELEVNIV